MFPELHKAETQEEKVSRHKHNNGLKVNYFNVSEHIYTLTLVSFGRPVRYCGYTLSVA